MAQKSLTANATASLSANGTSTATGSITWTVPAYPEGVTAWDSVMISGSWAWNGKGNITRVTINGTNTSADSTFNISIAGKTSPLSITCVGNNKNATGSNFQWSNLIVTYTYTQQGVPGVLTVRYGNNVLFSEEALVVNAVYDGMIITSVEEGHNIKTLTCGGKIMKSDLQIRSDLNIEGHTLYCAGKIMEYDIVLEVIY